MFSYIKLLKLLLLYLFSFLEIESEVVKLKRNKKGVIKENYKILS
jgi:hypothetical protein